LQLFIGFQSSFVLCIPRRKVDLFVGSLESSIAVVQSLTGSALDCELTQLAREVLDAAIRNSFVGRTHLLFPWVGLLTASNITA
jgi:hypothetical protein